MVRAAWGLRRRRSSAETTPSCSADVRQDRLDEAARTLDGLGITDKAVNCDVTDRKAVDALLETASGLGALASVIHTAGVSPSMGSAEYVMRTNAVGTVNVNEAFFARAGEGAAIVNVASMAAHMLPENMVPTKQFPQALHDRGRVHEGHAGGVRDRSRGDAVGHRLRASARASSGGTPSRSANGSTAKACASCRSRRDPSRPRWASWRRTPGAGAMVADAAVPRWGKPEEMADLLAFCASDKAGYLTGTDILNDGGVVASMTERARVAADSG